MSANTEKSNQLEDEPAKDTESNCDDEYDYDINNDELKNISESSSPTIAQSSNESEFESSENEEEKPQAKTKLANGEEPAEKETKPDEKSELELDAGKDDEEQQKAVDDANAALDKLLNSVDYGIVLAFLDKFATHLGIKEYTFKNFESNLINAKTGLIHL
jgi:hypothetical protein